MAQVMHHTSLWFGYRYVVKKLLEQGEFVSPRGLHTLELRDVTLQFDEVTSMPTGCGRGVNQAIGVAEALQLISGKSDPDLLCRITPNMKQFMDDTPGGLVQHGAYGPRAGWQAPRVIRRLLNDPDTRQAVISVYSPALDLHDPPPKDVPCTLNLAFAIRRDGLHMTTIMRSNDAWWGLAYDAFQFSQLQWSIAKSVNVPPAAYTHVVLSLHLYERDLEAARALHKPEPVEDPNHYMGVGRFGDAWDVIRLRASNLLEGYLPPDPTPTERAMWDHIHPYTVKDC